MAIILDIKNAIRDRIHLLDEGIHFNFNEMKTTQFPYVFFYIPSYRLDKAVNSFNYSKLDLMCVLEYEKQDKTQAVDLWAYSDTMSQILDIIPIYNGSLAPRNLEYKLVDGVLQATFDLTVYVKAEDEAELMKELEYTWNL